LTLEALLPILIQFAPRIGGGIIAGAFLGYYARKLFRWIILPLVAISLAIPTLLHILGIITITIHYDYIKHLLGMFPGATIWDIGSSNLSIIIPALLFGYIGIKKG